MSWAAAVGATALAAGVGAHVLASCYADPEGWAATARRARKAAAEAVGAAAEAGAGGRGREGKRADSPGASGPGPNEARRERLGLPAAATDDECRAREVATGAVGAALRKAAAAAAEELLAPVRTGAGGEEAVAAATPPPTGERRVCRDAAVGRHRPTFVGQWGVLRALARLALARALLAAGAAPARAAPKPCGQAEVAAAVLDVAAANPGMGVKKMVRMADTSRCASAPPFVQRLCARRQVAEVKKTYPELVAGGATVGAKEIRLALAARVAGRVRNTTPPAPAPLSGWALHSSFGEVAGCGRWRGWAGWRSVGRRAPAG